MQKNGLIGIILAAGKGRRMRSKLPKVMYPLCGRPMLGYVLETLSALSDLKRKIVIVGYNKDFVCEYINKYWPNIEIVVQERLLGTGHAVLQTEKFIKDFSEDLLVVCGDTPLLTKETLSTLISTHKKNNSEATMLTTTLEDPTGYGRIIRDKKGRILKIVEETEATDKEKKIKEINTGVYCFRQKEFFSALHAVSPSEVDNEYYLSSVIELLRKKGCVITAVHSPNAKEFFGVNDRVGLAYIESLIKISILEGLMKEGVTILSKETTFIDADVKIGVDTVIYPFTIIQGKTTIGENCVIGPNACIVNSEIGSSVTIKGSYVTDSIINEGVKIGPFSHIRPEVILGEGVKIGNFVELKKSVISKNTKISHLAYIGDASVGEGVNIGAGTITCNYDGRNKHQTKIADLAFIGSNTSLIAPLMIGKGAVIGAGSVITRDVPPDALGIARVRQKNILGWVKKRGEVKNDN